GEEREAEAGGQSAESVVLLRRPPFHQVAGMQHQVGRRIESVQGFDAPIQKRSGVDPPESEATLDLQVRVGDLGDDHSAGTPLPVALASAGRPPTTRGEGKQYRRSRPSIRT